ncbi:trp operon repressor [Marinobacterium sp. D7]|uniref:Transcriptional repressor protein TrpR n=1 Tax=Marinobacterium lacunae TaxID=1232683 RepID=A0A081FT08_9GAMM|nr:MULTISPECIES: Trp family transcriptional regulator [Marinobacterium]KEA61663.1 Transcriptional repressor protein TrpR [Marinobacterium lacunae]MBR9884332.1 helix-turn-helix domain-containing protein [Oceanospirillales bacterium]MBV1788733.1 trp operon repressor [Marinobacterium ramblicola]
MNTPYLDELLDHLLEMRDRASLEKALSELLTPSELTEVCKRLQILRLLEEGVPQREIARRLGVGIATVTRGSRALKSETP